MLFKIVVLIIMAAIVYTSFVSHEVSCDFVEPPIISIAAGGEPLRSPQTSVETFVGAECGEMAIVRMQRNAVVAIESISYCAPCIGWDAFG